MLYGLCALLSLFLGYWMREVLEVLGAIKKRLDKLELRQEEVKQQAKVGFAEERTAVEIMADMEAEKIRVLNR